MFSIDEVYALLPRDVWMSAAGIGYAWLTSVAGRIGMAGVRGVRSALAARRVRRLAEQEAAVQRVVERMLGGASKAT